MTEEDEEIYNNTNICWICSKEITENKVEIIVISQVNTEVLLTKIVI